MHGIVEYIPQGGTRTLEFIGELLFQLQRAISWLFLFVFLPFLISDCLTLLFEFRKGLADFILSVQTRNGEHGVAFVHGGPAGSGLFFNFCILYGVWLIYSVVLVPGIQQSN